VLTNGFQSGVLSAGTFTTLSVPGSTSTGAFGINNLGQIVGAYGDAGGKRHGFVLSGGIYTTIDVPGSTWTEADGINDSGQIVVNYGDAGGNGHSFLATPTAAPVPEPITLLLLGIGALAVIGWARLRLINRGGLRP
jgi:probable HAF family extracellular repeat protein